MDFLTKVLGASIVQNVQLGLQPFHPVPNQ
jgi:hypothetical protein